MELRMEQLVSRPFIFFVLVFLLMSLSSWIGAGVLRRKKQLERDTREDFGVVQAATLTLLALIIGFILSMAVERYDQRKNYEETEANAIGTEFIRADLLPAADAANIRSLLIKYLDERVRFYQVRDQQQLLEINSTTDSPDRSESATQSDLGIGSCRHERCDQLAGLYPGCMVESHPHRGVVADDCHCPVLQPANWLRRPQQGIEGTSVVHHAGGRLAVVRAGGRHRQSARRHYPGGSAESDQPGEIAAQAVK
jgi:hypothetical protein